MLPAGGGEQDANIAFVPLALPLMCGPGAIATILGMTSTIKQSSTELASICRHCGSHPRHYARDVFVSGLCRQAFRRN